MHKSSISIYGPFQALDSNGTRVDLTSTKSRHILTALILAHPEPLQRDQICKMMWPESSDESRKVRLRQELGILREFSAKLGLENLIGVDKGLLTLNDDGISIDCLEGRRLYGSFSSSLPFDQRLANLSEQVRVLGRGQIAPDALNFFDAERKRKCARLTTARIELTKLYIESDRLPEARQVLDAVLDEHPDNDVAKELSTKLLALPATVAGKQPFENSKTAPTNQQPRTKGSQSKFNWKVRVVIALVTVAVIIVFFYPNKVTLIPPANTPSIKTPPISEIIAYQYAPGPGELDDSEFIGADRLADGTVAVAGIVKTKTEDVDGIVVLLGTDLKPLWTRRISGPSHDADRLECAKIDGTRNVFAAGETYVVNQANIKDGWYGVVVAFDSKGKQLFRAQTRKPIIHGSEVKRQFAPDERGGGWYCSSTIIDGSERVFATHFDKTGRITNDIVLTGVRAKLLNFGRHTQDQYFVMANGRTTSSSSAGDDWLVAAFTNDGRILWTKQTDGPASANDVITSSIIARQDESHFVGGLQATKNRDSGQISLAPIVTAISMHTGEASKQVTLSSTSPNPHVSLFDLSQKNEIQVAIKEASSDSRLPINLYVVDSVTGAVKGSKNLTLPDGQYLSNIRRFVTNPKNGIHQVITNTARDIGTNASQAIIVSTIRDTGDAVHSIYKNIDRVTLNKVEQTIGVGQVDMGGRWPATVFNLPYPD